MWKYLLATLLGYEAVRGTNHNMRVMIGNEPHWVRIFEPEVTNQEILQKGDKQYASVKGKIKISRSPLS